MAEHKSKGVARTSMPTPRRSIPDNYESDSGSKQADLCKAAAKLVKGNGAGPKIPLR